MKHGDWAGLDLSGQLTEQTYRISGFLNEGGMAIVYRARTSLGVDVVVKTPLPALLKEQHFLARFEREIRTMARVRHPHIVPLLDHGIHQGIPFFVVPFYAGGTLADVMSRAASTKQTFSPSLTFSWLEPIAQAMDYLHERELFHRDLKPGNIFFDHAKKPVLADFGIVKVISDNTNGQATVFTQAGTVLGTPTYMAPELIMGQAVDHKIDIFALGVMVYECLTGKVPFEGTNPALVLSAQVKQQKVDFRSSAATSPIPPALREVIYRSLAFQPGSRYSTATEFARAYQEAMVREPTARIPDRPSGSKPEMSLPSRSEEVRTAKRLPEAEPEPTEIPEKEEAEPTPRRPLPPLSRTGLLGGVLVGLHCLLAWVAFSRGLTLITDPPMSVAVQEALFISRTPANGDVAKSGGMAFGIGDSLIALVLWPGLFLLCGYLLAVQHRFAPIFAVGLATILGHSAAMQLLGAVSIAKPVLLGGWVTPMFLGFLYPAVIAVFVAVPRWFVNIDSQNGWGAIGHLARVTLLLGTSLILLSVTAAIQIEGQYPNAVWLGISFAVILGFGLTLAGIGLIQRKPWARLLTLILGGVSILSLIGLPYFCAVVLILLRHDVTAEFASPKKPS